MTSSETDFILDISRLLARAGQNVPTGIDRVELAYAQYLLTHMPSHVFFVGLSLTGKMGALPYRLVNTLIASLSKGWNLGDRHHLKRAGIIAHLLKACLLLKRSLPDFTERPVYLLLSHHHLMRTKVIRDFLQQTNALFVPMIHDLIPIEYPEYARPREPGRHKARLRTVISLADAVIVPTQPVRKSLQYYFTDLGRTEIPVWTVSHGVHEQVLQRLSKALPARQTAKPFFIYLSTIEPRKNHLLLLHLWRRMVKQRGKEATPQLILIGKRGWENENILDLLERCPALQELVIEENGLSDEDVAGLLKASNGLLFPSFVEGYGLPVTEAMSLGIPCICADIPVLHEIGEEKLLYIDPLDSLAWQKAIDDFTLRGPLWQAQKERLTNWQPIDWTQSVSEALFHCQSLKTALSRA